MAAPPAGRLDSWKEIAAYLNRGVRTVRRWETDEGLPVHRHTHRALGSVYAYKSEIDAWRATRAAVPKPSPVKSIAILPFANLSTEPDDEYFADGLTEEVIADLSAVRSLHVISRTSSMTLKGTTKDAKTIARELRVDYILEGSVRRARGRLRVSARLIDAQQDTHLWANKYEGTLDDVFAIQDGIAGLIVQALALKLTDDEERRIAMRPIGNVLAYDCYLRARHEAFRWRRDAIDRAIQLLNEGLRIVGDNAELYAALGSAYLQYREAGLDVSEHPLAMAEAATRKVFALDPMSARGRHLRGWLHYARGMVPEAVRDLASALEMQASNPDTLLLLCNCYLISGKVSSARPLIDRLQSLDPLTPLTRCLPGWAAVLEGRFADAIPPYQLMFEMDQGNPMGRLFYVWVLALNNQLAAIDPLVRGFSDEVRDTLPARVARFLAYAMAGNLRQAEAELPPDIESFAIASDVFPRFLAQGFARLDAPERALYWLRLAVDRGFINYPYLSKHDPFFERLRNREDFRQLMELVHDRWQLNQTLTGP